jgi:hypothetical protein
MMLLRRYPAGAAHTVRQFGDETNDRTNGAGRRFAVGIKRWE